MAGRLVVGIIALILASVCGFISSLTQFEMMDKVNAKLPKEDQFDPAWWYYSKTNRIHREYTRLYPTGQLLRRARILWGVMCVCMLICALSLGILGK
jgi:hypothetical protein